MEKTQYRESCRLDTYRVDRNEIGKPSGLWQLMQEAASNQMEAQKPSYTDLVDAGQAADAGTRGSCDSRSRLG